MTIIHFTNDDTTGEKEKVTTLCGVTVPFYHTVDHADRDKAQRLIGGFANLALCQECKTTRVVEVFNV